MAILTTRKDIAQALNFGKYPVLSFDLDNDKGSYAVVLYETNNYGTLRKGCTLNRGKVKRDDGIFYLLTHASILSAHVSIDDYLKNVSLANAPVIKEGDTVAIFIYSKIAEIAYVELVKAGKVTPDYSTSVTFTEI